MGSPKHQALTAESRPSEGASRPQGKERGESKPAPSWDFACTSLPPSGVCCKAGSKPLLKLFIKGKCKTRSSREGRHTQGKLTWPGRAFPADWTWGIGRVSFHTWQLSASVSAQCCLGRPRARRFWIMVAVNTFTELTEMQELVPSPVYSHDNL